MSKDDVFIIDVVRKVKDHNTWNWNTSINCYNNDLGILIKYYIIEDIDSLNKYLSEIIDICDVCGCRAYISVSPRNKSLIKKKIKVLSDSKYCPDYYSFVCDEIIKDENLITNKSFIVKLNNEDLSYKSITSLTNIFKFHSIDSDTEVYRYTTKSGEQFILFGPFDNNERLINEIKTSIPSAKINSTGGILLYMNVEDEK